MPTPTLSPSSIGLFMDCPRCFWLQAVKGVRRPEGIFPSLPGGMDRLLKAHFDQHRKDGSVPEELRGKFEGKLFPDMEKLGIWRNNKNGLRYLHRETGIELMGAIDDLFVTSDGRYAPLDYKTRGYPRKDDTHEFYQHQMDIYSFLLGKNGLSPADFAILIFYHPVDVNEKCEVEFSPDPLRVAVDRLRGEKLFSEAVACLLGKEPEPGKECEWCRFHQVTTE